MKIRSCFVISPIGEVGGEIRKKADDLFDLLIEQALQKFNFEITRADKIAKSTSITADIISHVQNADLCIIDLTGVNPNVMYEFGRRHETGKPFIMIAEKGEELPFDVTSIRTFFYELKDPRSILNSIKDIQNVVDGLLTDPDGFAPKSSGESLSTIATSLSRIERKLTEVMGGNHTRNTTRQVHSVDRGKPEILNNLSVIDAYQYYWRQKQYKQLRPVMPYLIDAISNDEVRLSYTITMADESAECAEDVEKHILDFDFNNEDLPYQLAFINVSNYYYSQGLSKEKIEFLTIFYDKLYPTITDPKAKAYVVNNMNRHLYAIKDFEQVYERGLTAISLVVDDPSYYYNHALVCEKLDKQEEMLATIDSYINLGTEDSDHLSLAIVNYSKNGRLKEAKILWEQLNAVNNYKAELLLEYINEDESKEAEE